MKNDKKTIFIEYLGLCIGCVAMLSLAACSRSSMLVRPLLLPNQQHTRYAGVDSLISERTGGREVRLKQVADNFIAPDMLMFDVVAQQNGKPTPLSMHATVQGMRVPVLSYYESMARLQARWDTLERLETTADPAAANIVPILDNRTCNGRFYATCEMDYLPEYMLDSLSNPQARVLERTMLQAQVRMEQSMYMLEMQATLLGPATAIPEDQSAGRLLLGPLPDVSPKGKNSQLDMQVKQAEANHDFHFRLLPGKDG